MREIENQFDGTYLMSRACADCGTKYLAKINGPDLFRYNHGAFVQECFPYLTAAQRELFFMSGICGDCWDRLFVETEEDNHA